MLGKPHDRLYRHYPGESKALDYLAGHAQEWWIVYNDIEEGLTITSWSDLKGALIKRIETLNKGNDASLL